MEDSKIPRSTSSTTRAGTATRSSPAGKRAAPKKKPATKTATSQSKAKPATGAPRKSKANPPRMSSMAFNPLGLDFPDMTQAAERSTQRKPASVLPKASTIATAENFLSGLANLAPGRLTSQVKNVAEQVMGWAGTAAEMAVGATAPLVKEPGRRAALEKAGAVLRDARETAGMTASDVSAALDFSDTNLLDLAESGRIALPFEVILRLASLLARNDPIPFVMNLTRFYNPGLWKIIEQLGIGKLALHVGREREFMNIYRSYDAARQLRDDEFKLILQFTGSAFETAVDLALLGQPRRNKAKEAKEGKDTKDSKGKQPPEEKAD
jgi:hypothetical protein